MRYIYSVDGAKGGVGKSMVAGSVIDYIMQNDIQHPPLVVDGDNSNPDIAKTYGSGCRCITPDMDSRDGILALAAALDTAQEQYVVISQAARAHGMMIYGQDMIDSLADINCTLICMWVLSRQRDSIETMIEYREALPDVTIIPVVNTYFGDQSKFELWNNSECRKSVMAQNGGIEIIYPDMADRIADTMRNNRITWADAMQLPFGHKIEVQRVRRTVHTALSVVPGLEV